MKRHVTVVLSLIVLCTIGLSIPVTSRAATERAARGKQGMTSFDSGTAPKGTNSPSEKLLGIIKRANEGNAEAQLALARMYRKGDQVRKSEFEGSRWFRRAADQGNKWAQYELGLYYEKEIRDYQKAACWYEKAAEQGLACAQNDFAMLYGYSGVKLELTTAIAWLQAASRQGHATAKQNLARLIKDNAQDLDAHEQAALAGRSAVPSIELVGRQARLPGESPATWAWQYYTVQGYSYMRPPPGWNKSRSVLSEDKDLRRGEPEREPILCKRHGYRLLTTGA